jgi:hypothetical protein
MFVLTVVSVGGETSAKAFEAMSNARQRARTGALSEFEGDVAGITIHETVADHPRQAIDEVKNGGGKFLEGRAHPITAEEADRVAKAEAIRFLAGTSVEQIERFYTKNLEISSELAKNLQTFGGKE